MFSSTGSPKLSVSLKKIMHNKVFKVSDSDSNSDSDREDIYSQSPQKIKYKLYFFYYNY